MRTQTEQTYRERVLRTLVHIQQHLDDDLGLDELAGVARFSPYHFHRVFRGLVGVSVSWAFDLVMFSAGPVQMPVPEYMEDIGLTYLIIPTVAGGFGKIAPAAPTQ